MHPLAPLSRFVYLKYFRRYSWGKRDLMRLINYIAVLAVISCRLVSVCAQDDSDFGDDLDDDGGVRAERLPQLSQASSVKDAFRFSWNSYVQYALGTDELLSVDRTGNNSRYGWGDSVIDGLTTAIVMELSDIVLQQLAFVCKIDFKIPKTGGRISLVDVTNRYLGGMLSAYDLLSGPYKALVPRRNSSLVDCLPKQAKTLADLVKVAFNTPSGVPDDVLLPNGSGGYKIAGSTTTISTNVGWLILEWTRLSDVLKDISYATLVQKSESYLLNPKLPEASYPGFIGKEIFLANGTFNDAEGNWGKDLTLFGDAGGGYFEYLIKMYAYNPTKFATHKDLWVKAAESAAMYTFSTTLRINKHYDLTLVAGFQGLFRDSIETHGSCTIGANLFLGGISTRRNDLIKYGEKPVRGCREIYAVQPTGIGYAITSWIDLDWFWTWPTFQSYQANGFYAFDYSYTLRSEYIESLYYGYVITGKEKYRDWAWEAFKAMNKSCRTASGFSGLLNTSAVDGGGFDGVQSSWWLSQTLKYFYLIFSEDSRAGVSDTRRQDWVFNTDGHPLRTMR